MKPKNKELILKELGIYIHIPFCKQKCYYCDFYSLPNKEELIDKYVKELLTEIKEFFITNKEKFNITTIYIGGRNTFIYRQ